MASVRDEIATQLMFDFAPALEREPLPGNETWLDVSDLARGVGFTTTVLLSPSLEDSLRVQGADYDQCLYDALWAAYFRLSLERCPSVTFQFAFQRKAAKKVEEAEAKLRLRVEYQRQAVRLGRLGDF